MLNSALQRRTLTASVLAPLAIAGVLLLPTPHFAMLFGLVLLIAAWEWSALAGIGAFAGRGAFVVTTASALFLLWQGMAGQWVPSVLALLTLWWFGLAVYLFRIREIETSEGFAPWLLASAVPVLLGSWLAIVYLHGSSESGPKLVLFLLILIWTADIAAYFAGRRWGTTKLAPVLSPGKTWAGVSGALAGAVLAGLVLAWALGFSSAPAGVAVILCVATAFISVVGDLYESLIKRRRGVKDSGGLLPGHGGMLDRIDSLMAAAPVFTLGVLYLGAQL